MVCVMVNVEGVKGGVDGCKGFSCTVEACPWHVADLLPSAVSSSPSPDIPVPDKVCSRSPPRKGCNSSGLLAVPSSPRLAIPSVPYTNQLNTLFLSYFDEKLEVGGVGKKRVGNEQKEK